MPNGLRPMPEEVKPLALEEKPKVEKKIPEIYVMPEKFLGAPVGPPIPPKAPPRVPQPKVEKPPIAPPKPPIPKAPKKRRRWLVWLIIGILFIFLNVVAAGLILFPKKEAPPSPPALPPPKAEEVTIPTPPPPPPPPTPVCGNQICEEGEDEVSCSLDCAPSPPAPLRSGSDEDSDGLTDVEETTIYKTDPLKVDSDGDTFNDGNEVSHLFDPTRKAPATLKDSGLITLHHHSEPSYEIFYPSSWQIETAPTGEVFFRAANGEFVEVLVREKPKLQSVIDWYLSISPGVSRAELQTIRTKGRIDGVLSPDRLTAYLDGEERVYVITYNLGIKRDVEFRTTYEMIINSFSIIK